MISSIRSGVIRGRSAMIIRIGSDYTCLLHGFHHVCDKSFSRSVNNCQLPFPCPPTLPTPIFCHGHVLRDGNEYPVSRAVQQGGHNVVYQRPAEQLHQGLLAHPQAGAFPASHHQRIQGSTPPKVNAAARATARQISLVAPIPSPVAPPKFLFATTTR